LRFVVFLFLLITAVCCPLTIIFTTDIHEHLFSFDPQGFAYGPMNIRDFARNMELEDALFLDAGDLFDSKVQVPFFADSRNETLRYLSSAKYDAMVLGNHEFYFGSAWLENYKASNKALIGANVPNLPSFRIFERGGKRIAVVGLTTSQHLANQVEHYGKMPTDPLEALERALHEMPLVDFIICLNHLQHELDLEILKRFPQVDLILSGHDHRGPEVTTEGSRVLFEGSCYSDSVFLIEVNLETKEMHYKTIKPYVTVSESQQFSSAIKRDIATGIVLGSLLGIALLLKSVIP